MYDACVLLPPLRVSARISVFLARSDLIASEIGMISDERVEG